MNQFPFITAGTLSLMCKLHSGKQPQPKQSYSTESQTPNRSAWTPDGPQVIKNKKATWFIVSNNISLTPLDTFLEPTPLYEFSIQ